MSTVFWKELKAHKLVILIVVASIIAFAFIEWRNYNLNMDSYRMMLKNPNHLSPARIEMLKEELSQFRNFGNYMLAFWYLGPSMALILFTSIFIGAHMLGHERRRKTLDYLFTRPLRREKIIAGKFLAGISIISLMNFIPLVAAPLISAFSGKNIVFFPFLCASVCSTVGLFAIYSIAFFASILEKFQTWFSFFTALGIYFFWTAVKDFFHHQWIKSLDFDMMFANVKTYISGSFGGYLPFVIGGGIIVTMFLLSVWKIRRVDIP